MTETIKKIIFNLLWLILVLIGGYANYYFSDHGVSANFNVIPVQLPASFGIDEKIQNETMGNLSLMRIFVNTSLSTISVSSIKIRGVNKFEGWSARLFSKSEDVSDLTPKDVHVYSDKLGREIHVSGFDNLSTNYRLVLYIWGQFGEYQSVEVKTGNNVYFAKEAKFVSGVELFLATYWRFLILLIFVVLLFGYYKYKVNCIKQSIT